MASVCGVLHLVLQWPVHMVFYTLYCNGQCMWGFTPCTAMASVCGALVFRCCAAMAALVFPFCTAMADVCVALEWNELYKLACPRCHHRMSFTASVSSVSSQLCR